MTCIVGLEHDGKVYIGGDSMTSDSDSYNVSRNPKVFKTGRYLIGFTSSWRMGQILQYYGAKAPCKARDPLKHLVTEFVPYIIRVMKKQGFARTKDDEVSGGSFLLGYQKKLYHIHDDFQVASSAYGMNACGSGEQFALGALEITRGDPEARIKKALDAASKFSTGCCPPYIILST